MTLARTYLDAARNALRAVARAPWTLLLPVAYLLVFQLVASLLVPLGMVGAFLASVVLDLLLSSYLYVVGELLAGHKLRLRHMPSSIWPLLFPIWGVLFVLWIASLLLGPLVATHPQGALIMLLITLVEYVVFNAVPEVVYQKRMTGGIDTLATGVRFIQENWIEWFIPNLALGAALWFGLPRLDERLPWWAAGIVLGALLHMVMLFRGALFHDLDTTSPRQRAMRYRR